MSLLSIKREIWPPVNFDVTVVGTAFPGASPSQIENLISAPLEDEISQVDGIKEIQSLSFQNYSTIYLTLDPDHPNKKEVHENIQSVVKSYNDLPVGAEDPLIEKVEASQIPVLDIFISADVPPLELRKKTKDLALLIEQIGAVARVQENGVENLEYQVEVDPIKMKQRGVTLTQVIGALERQNAAIPAGTHLEPSGLEVSIRVDSEFISGEDILNTSITSNDSGYGTLLSDVATVSLGTEKPRRLYRIQGKKGLSLVVLKKSNGDALKLVDEVKIVVSDFEKANPEYKVYLSNDYSRFLATRIKALGSNLIIGLILVLIILSLFLPWQVTLIVTLGIPIAMLLAVSAMQLLGFSFNLISLLGLIIVTGMVVDDAIVVCENIWRQIELGETPHSAAIKGTMQVIAPVTASVLTTIFAFGPMMFMSGIFGAFVQQIPVAVILALVFSLFEAFLLLPSHFASWSPFLISAKKLKQKQTKHSRFQKVAAKYGQFVHWSLKKRYLMLVLLIVFLGGTAGYIGKSGRFVLFPPEGIEMFFIRVEAPIGTPLDQTAEALRPIESYLLENLSSEYLIDVSTTVGFVSQGAMDPQAKSGSHYAYLRVQLTPEHTRDRKTIELMESLRKPIEQVVANDVSLFFELEQQGPPQGKPITLNIRGSNYKRLQEFAELVKGYLKTVDGVKDIQDSTVLGPPEWLVQIDSRKAASLGVSSQSVAISLRAAFDGVVATEIRDNEEEIKIKVKLATQNKETKELLKNLSVGNNFGRLVPLNQFANFKQEQDLIQRTRLDLKKVLYVTGDIDTNVTTALEATNKLKDFLKTEPQIKAYSDVSYTWGGAEKDSKESMQSLLKTFLIAVSLIYLLLVITFNNLIQPALIILSMPFGFLGASLALLSHGRPFSFMGMLGIVALGGVIVNNSIVLIDFINSRRKNGDRFNKSIVDSSIDRLRPILLTTATTVCGLLPTAYGAAVFNLTGMGGVDPFIIPVALSLGWGLAFGSLMVLIFFPSMIRISDDLQFWKKDTPDLQGEDNNNDHKYEPSIATLDLEPETLS